MNIFLNRENITLINKIRAMWGADRSAQTNSRKNGKFGIIRLYNRPEDKGKISRAVVTLDSPAELVEWVRKNENQ